MHLQQLIEKAQPLAKAPLEVPSSSLIAAHELHHASAADAGHALGRRLVHSQAGPIGKGGGKGGGGFVPEVVPLASSRRTCLFWLMLNCAQYGGWSAMGKTLVEKHVYVHLPCVEE